MGHGLSSIYSQVMDNTFLEMRDVLYWTDR